MMTASGTRTDNTFTSPAAQRQVKAILDLVGQQPGIPASTIMAECRMSHTTANVYLVHLAQIGKLVSTKPDKGKGLRWHLSRAARAAATRKKNDGRTINRVRAQDCAPVAVSDPFRAFMFGGR